MNKPLIVFIFISLLINVELYAESGFKIFHTHQSAETLLSTIAPLYGNAAKITTRNNTLIVKAPNSILHEIEQLLKEIDKPSKNLLIEVISSLSGYDTLQENGVEGRIELGDKTGISSKPPIQQNPNLRIRYGKDGSVIRTTHTRRKSSRDNPDHFKIRAVEGRWSTIQVGQKVPYYTSNNSSNSKHHPWNKSVNLVDVTSGFEVYPLLNGDRVTLKVRPHNRSLNQKYSDRINTRSMDTIISGKIDQWLYLGGASNQVNEQGGGYTHSTKRHSEQETTYRIKVSILD